MVLDLGYEVLWSDMDAAWLQLFFQLAPAGLDYVGVDDSDAENEQVANRFADPCTHQIGCTVQPLQRCVLSPGQF